MTSETGGVRQRRSHRKICPRRGYRHSQNATMGMMRIRNNYSGAFLLRRVRIIRPRLPRLWTSRMTTTTKRIIDRNHGRRERRRISMMVVQDRGCFHCCRFRRHTLEVGDVSSCLGLIAANRHCTGRTSTTVETNWETAAFSDVMITENKYPLHFVSSPFPLPPNFFIPSLLSLPVPHSPPPGGRINKL